MKTEYKISDVAQLLKTTVRTIRYYEEEGLLQPLRTNGGTRLYRQNHISRLRSILNLVENGFSLESIHAISTIRETCKTGNEGSQKVTALLDDKINDISAHIQNLEHLKNEITRAKKLVKKCRGCRNKPTTKDCPTCPIKQNTESVELLNLIWDQDN